MQNRRSSCEVKAQGAHQPVMCRRSPVDHKAASELNLHKSERDPWRKKQQQTLIRYANAKVGSRNSLG